MSGNLSGFDASEHTTALQPSFEPNRFQREVFRETEHESGHLVVQARAGTGKTTTIVQAASLIPPGQSVLLCAFNKAIQLELASRVSGNVAVRTLHSLGFGCLRRHGSFTVDGNRTRALIQNYLKKRNELYIKGRQGGLHRLIGLAKNTLTYGHRELENFAYNHGIEDWDNPANVLARQTIEILEQCKEMTGVIDFDDMIWLPVVHNIKPRTYNVVFVDEAQDLNNCQRWMIDQTIGANGRLIAVGDPRQAIYGFRGAGNNVIDDLVATFDAKVLPLSITYRCPKKVVELAKDTVPDYEASESAPDGTVTDCSWDDCVTGAKPGCFILSRTNAPLMRMCIALLARDVPVRIAGKNIGKNMITLLEKSKAATVADATAWLDDFKAAEAERLLPDRKKAYELVCDKVDCLNVMMEGEKTTNNVIEKITRLFSDTDSTGVVMCSTVHKAKGLERPVVWVLTDTFRRWGSKEEQNLWYVALTRTQGTLMMVSGGV